MPLHSWSLHHAENIKLALPIVVGALATIGIWTVDVMAMGQLGSTKLAAGSLGMRYYQPLYFLALGITLAVGPLVAQGLGANEPRQIRRALRQGIVIAIALGLLSAPIVITGGTVLVWLGQDPALTNLLGGYLIWSAIGLPFIFIFFVLRQYMVAHQRPTPQVIAMIIGLAADVGLNHIAVHGMGPMPPTGLAGIAATTSLVYLFICIGLMIYIGRSSPYRESAPFQRLWVMDWDITKRLLKIGFPIGLTIVAESGMFIAVTLMIGLFGTAALAAGAIANQIAAIAFMVPIALAQASSIRVSVFAGASDRSNTIRSGWSAIMVGLAICGFTMAVLWIAPALWIEFFIAPDDVRFDQVMAFAVPMVIVAAIFQIPDGIQAIATSVLRGLNDTKIPAYIGIFCFWCLGVASGGVAGFLFDGGPVAVWAGLVLGLLAAALGLLYRMIRAMRRIQAGGDIIIQ